MKKLLLAATAVTALFAAGAASAEVSYNVAVTSDYVWRGLSQNDEDVALSAGVDYTSGLAYVGAWVSQTEAGSGTELNLYAGVKPTYNDFTFDIGAIYYNFGDDVNGLGNATELKLGVSHPLGQGSVYGNYYKNLDFSSDVIADSYLEVGAAYPLTEKLAVSGAIGKYLEEGDLGVPGYTNYNLGLSYAITDVFSVDGRYSDTSGTKGVFGDYADERFVVTLKAAF